MKPDWMSNGRLEVSFRADGVALVEIGQSQMEVSPRERLNRKERRRLAKQRRGKRHP